MTETFRIFVSSVQKELEDERLIVQNLVNAAAHRQYEDAGRKTLLEVFTDRVAISSPGLPPKPITLASLRREKYRPCSRNPVLAQCLSYFHRIEERGSGFRRMREHMLNHGLDQPLLSTEMGYFQVTFTGPGDNIDRLRVSEDRLIVTKSIEEQLNDRQKQIVKHVLEHGSVTQRWCVSQFQIANDTAGRDLKHLKDTGLLISEGKGRAVRYVFGTTTQPTDNRPA